MHGGIDNVSYWYTNPGFSPRAVEHAFDYISAVTGIRFVRDRTAPQLWRSDHESVPENVGIILGAAKDSRVSEKSHVGSGDQSGRFFVDNDPVEGIMRKLSLTARLGPESGIYPGRHKDTGPLLSRLITYLVSTLAHVGAAKPGSRTVTLWPDEKRFAVAVSHDIDIVRRSVMGSIRLLWHKEPPGRVRGLVDSVRSVFGGPNPYDRIPEWLQMEENYRIKSTFFVFAGDRKHVHDPKYRLADLSEAMSRIVERDFEPALHSGITCHSGDNLSSSRSILEDFAGERIVGLRPHYLSAHLPEYWRSASRAGFAYTSCLGFDDDAGHFDGIDLPFVPFDAENDAAIDIVEMPIAIMDCGLIDGQPAISDDVFRRGRELIDAAAETGGMIVLDWHQRTLYDADYPGWGSLFEKLIEYSRLKGACFGAMRDISSLLKNRMAGAI